MTKTVALVQARMGSSRLRGKVLADLDGRPMIRFMFDRIRRAKSLDAAVLLTSTDPDDHELVMFAESQDIPVVTGPLDDVLARYRIGAEQTNADVIVRLTGDCPFIDPAVIDDVVALRKNDNVDYASNIDPPTFADGLDVECFTRDALLRADGEATDARFREHVTLWMREGDSGLSRANLTATEPFDDVRITVDYEDDLKLVRGIAKALEGNAADASYADILKVLEDRPDFRQPARHQRNEALNR